MDRENAPQIAESRIDALGHIITDTTNQKIDVFSAENVGVDRAQIYQSWAIGKFAANDVVYDALDRYKLAGFDTNKEKWTQLLEHISGVTAIANHLEGLLEKYGAAEIDSDHIYTATLLDNIDKPQAIEAGTEALDTATLIHDIEKPAELAAGAGGLENSRDNPVLREGRLWTYLHEQGISDEIILAAQNTGRSDRFFSELDDYSDDAVKKALEDRQALANLLSIDRDEIDTMSPSERRRASIEAKGRLAALVGISDAMAAQFRFQGFSENDIDSMSKHYLTYKTDPESVAFFGQDWPEYYKEVRRYLIAQVPAKNRAELEKELDDLDHETVFNDTVLPEVLGKIAMARVSQQARNGERTIYDRLKYDRFQAVTTWERAKDKHNEDVTFSDETTLALADGATDKSGVTYPSGKTGGRELAEIATQIASKSDKIGYPLADEITEKVREFYQKNNPEALTDSSKRAATTLVVAKLIEDRLVVTQIGDTNFRITMEDGSQHIFTNGKRIDKENARIRSEHIATELEHFVDTHQREPSDEERKNIVANGRAVILDRLKNQHTLQNNGDDEQYGYGTIDGTAIPQTFTSGAPTNYVNVFTFPRDAVTQIEIVSDGFYEEFPSESDQASYEALYDTIHEEDPEKIKAFQSTKPIDDASVLIAKLR